MIEITIYLCNKSGTFHKLNPLKTYSKRGAAQEGWETCLFLSPEESSCCFLRSPKITAPVQYLLLKEPPLMENPF